MAAGRFGQEGRSDGRAGDRGRERGGGRVGGRAGRAGGRAEKAVDGCDDACTNCGRGEEGTGALGFAYEDRQVYGRILFLAGVQIASVALLVYINKHTLYSKIQRYQQRHRHQQ